MPEAILKETGGAGLAVVSAYLAGDVAVVGEAHAPEQGLADGKEGRIQRFSLGKDWAKHNGPSDRGEGRQLFLG